MKIIEETKQGVPFLQADGIRDAGGAAHGFSTRLGGVSQGMWASLNLGVSRGDNPEHVRENYRRFFSAIGADGRKLVGTNQVHGGKVRVVTAADWKGDPYERVDYEADGLMTDTPGVVLLIYSADCIPVLLYDPVRRVAAAVHAGWRGTAAGIAATAVERMKEVYDCRPEDILAAVGPGIGPCCFETHADVPDAMTAAFGGAAAAYMAPQPDKPGKWSVDLKAINAWRLREAGVAAEHIDVCPLCTACRPDLYWSHRKMGNHRGVQGALIGLVSGEEAAQ